MQPATKESRKHRKSESVEIKRISPVIAKPALSEKQVEELLIDNMRLKRELSSLKETITVLKARLLKCGDDVTQPFQKDLQLHLERDRLIFKVDRKQKSLTEAYDKITEL